MQLNKYPLIAGEGYKSFEFVSIGKRGEIRKVVKFQKTYFKEVYNLAFGDLNQLTGEFNDKVISDNGDSLKVLATIVASVYVFTEHHPDAWIFATGSTPSRTRLYKIGLSRFLDETRRDYLILGILNCKREYF